MPGLLWPLFLSARCRSIERFCLKGNRRYTYGEEQPGSITVKETVLKLFPEVSTRNLSNERALFVAFLTAKFDSLPQASVNSVIKDINDKEQIHERLCDILRALTEWLPQRGKNSIDKVLDALKDEPGFRSPADNLQKDLQRQTVFTMIGWMSCLYQPVEAVPPISNEEVWASQSPILLCSNHGNRDAERASRPVFELLCGFDEYLPTNIMTNGGLGPSANEDKTMEKAIHVSNVNISALKRIGLLKIVWTTSVAAHLYFDHIERTLQLFAMPSFCRLCKGQNQTVSSTLLRECAKVLGCHPVSDDWYKEIELSFELLYAQDHRSRQEFRKVDRDRAWHCICSPSLSLRTPRDTHLDYLCGFHIDPPWYSRYILFIPRHLDIPPRASYSAQYDFPIFSQRLLRLQSYMESIQVNDISTLWRDRRDLLRWYTFWAVAIIGGVGLVFALVQDILAAAQLSYAVKAYETQAP